MNSASMRFYARDVSNFSAVRGKDGGDWVDQERNRPQASTDMERIHAWIGQVGAAGVLVK